MQLHEFANIFGYFVYSLSANYLFWSHLK